MLTVILWSFFTAFVVFLACTITSRGYELKEPKISPSGDYELQTLFGRDEFNDYVKPYIVSAIGSDGVSYIVDKKFYTNFHIIMQWGESDTLWVYSSDVGIYCWELVNRTCMEIPYENLNYDLAPEKIKEYINK